MAPSHTISKSIDALQEELRDRFDPIGPQVFEQLVNIAAERRAISNAEELLRKQWIRHEWEKINETLEQKQETDLKLLGFIYWENKNTKIVTNANQWKISEQHRKVVIEEYPHSPIISKSYKTDNDFFKIQKARQDFRELLLETFINRFKTQMAIFNETLRIKERLRIEESAATKTYLFYKHEWRIS